MADIQVTVVDFKGIEDQVSGGKAVIGYGKVVLRNVPCLCRRRVGTAMLQDDAKLAVYPVGKGTAVEIAFLVPLLLAVRRAQLCQGEVNGFVPGLPRYQVRVGFHQINRVK